MNKHIHIYTYIQGRNKPGNNFGVFDLGVSLILGAFLCIFYGLITGTDSFGCLNPENPSKDAHAYMHI